MRLDVADHHRLKAAIRDLVQAAGGPAAVQDILSVGSSTVSRWVRAEHDDMPALAQIIRLEQVTGRPIVTQAQARLHGLVCEPAPAADEAGNLAACSGHMAAAVLAVHGAIGEALADGTVTPAEADIIDRCASRAATTIVDLRDAAASVKAGRARA